LIAREPGVAERGGAVLALDELLEAEGTPYRPPDGGGPKGGRRVRAVA
jgi:hypothetical protein